MMKKNTNDEKKKYIYTHMHNPLPRTPLLNDACNTHYDHFSIIERGGGGGEEA
jgi:hypothetical protein